MLNLVVFTKNTPEYLYNFLINYHIILYYTLVICIIFLIYYSRFFLYTLYLPVFFFWFFNYTIAFNLLLQLNINLLFN